MEINTTIKTTQGTVKFQGELSQEEADYVIQTGLNYLLSKGEIPFVVVNNEDDMKDFPGGTESEQ